MNWTLLLSIFVLGACASGPTTDTTAEAIGQTGTATIKTRDGKKLGDLKVVHHKDGIKIIGKLTGLPKSSTHGFHIHQNGECEGDFKSAGSHYDPMNTNKHGRMHAKTHAGDFGNIKTNKQGSVTIDKFKKGLKLESSEPKYELYGKAFIIHAKNDEFQPQPSGNAGPRIACGVIQEK